MRFILFLVTIFLGIQLQCQTNSSDTIFYIMPRCVDEKVNDYINGLLDENRNKYLICEIIEHNDTVTIRLLSSNKAFSEKLNRLTSITNRFLVTDVAKIPIFFRSDFLLSNIINTVDTSGVVASIGTLTMSGGGYYLKFTATPGSRECELIEAVYYQ